MMFFLRKLVSGADRWNRSFDELHSNHETKPTAFWKPSSNGTEIERRRSSSALRKIGERIRSGAHAAALAHADRAHFDRRPASEVAEGELKPSLHPRGRPAPNAALTRRTRWPTRHSHATGAANDLKPAPANHRQGHAARFQLCFTCRIKNSIA